MEGSLKKKKSTALPQMEVGYEPGACLLEESSELDIEV